MWINFGPLLYHWASDVDYEEENPSSDMDDRYSRSIELSWEEVRHVIQTLKFDIVREETRPCNYACNPKSMMKTVYDCVFMTAIKPLDGS